MFIEEAIKGRRYELGHKSTILVMRWLVVLLVIFISIYSARGFDFFSANYLLAMAIVAANAVISLFPQRFFEKPWLTYLLFLIDIAFVSAMIYFSEGINTDFYLVYFLSIFMSSIGRSVGGAVPVAVIASAMYGWLMYRQGGLEVMATPTFWLRVPFFLLVALFTSLWASQVEKERKERREAEQFKERLEREIEIATREILRTSENFRTLKEYNENILASISSGVMVVDMDGVVTTFNREAVNIFKTLSHSVIGRKIEELGCFGPLADLLRKTLETGCPQQRQEMNLALEGGREITIGVSTSILHQQTPRSNGAIAVFQDITAHRSLEERVRQSEKLAVLGQMAAVMAHEIRNPLNSIAGFAQLLQARKEADLKIAQYVEIIVQEAFRIDAIISDILDFAHKKKLNLEDVRVDELLSRIMNNGCLARCDKEIELRMVLEDDLPVIQADAVRLERALVNLINNAREAIIDRGRVEVRAQAVGPGGEAGVNITVADDGPGIPPEMLEKIFQPFFTTKSRGTGLGLAIIQRIVEEHRGRLDVQSRVGQGTGFRIFLPARAA